MEKDLPPRVAHGLALVMAAIAGFVDAMTFLALCRVFASMMTGNIITFFVALALGQGTRAAWLHALVIAVFAAGSALGAAILEVLRRRGLHARIVTAALLLLEMLLLLGMYLLWRVWAPGHAAQPAEWRTYWLASCAALAMSLHLIALERVGELPVLTNFMSGTLSGLFRNIVQFQFCRRAAAADPAAAANRDRCRAFIHVRAPTLVCFCLGVALGAALTQRLDLVAVLVPAAALGLCAAFLLLYDMEQH